MNHEKRIKDVTVRSVLSSNVYKMIGFRMSSRTVNEIDAFVPSKNQHPKLFDPRQQISLKDDEILEQDIECEPIRENFSVYKMDNGDTVSLKTVVGEITKFKKYTSTGEPIYNVNPTPILKIKKNKSY